MGTSDVFCFFYLPLLASQFSLLFFFGYALSNPIEHTWDQRSCSQSKHLMTQCAKDLRIICWIHPTEALPSAQNQRERRKDKAIKIVLGCSLSKLKLSINIELFRLKSCYFLNESLARDLGPWIESQPNISGALGLSLQYHLIWVFNPSQSRSQNWRIRFSSLSAARGPGLQSQNNERWV